MAEYPINKGVGRQVEFKGLRAQYLFLFAGGLLAVFILVVVLYMGGDDTSRMPPCGEELHQSVSPVLAVQTEGQRHKRAAHPHARDKACHLIDSAHIKYDYENENGEQAAGERKFPI